MLGGIQPDKLAPVLQGDDDGFVSRFLWSWPEPTTEFSLASARVDSRAQELALGRIFDLEMQALMDGERYPLSVPLSAEAAAIFEVFGRENKHQSLKSHGLMAHTFGKANGHAARLAMVLCMLDWSHQGGVALPECIEWKYVDAAIRLMRDYFLPMARIVFGDASRPEAETNAIRLAKYLRDKSNRNSMHARLVGSLPAAWKIRTTGTPHVNA